MIEMSTTSIYPLLFEKFEYKKKSCFIINQFEILTGQWWSFFNILKVYLNGVGLLLLLAFLMNWVKLN